MKRSIVPERVTADVEWREAHATSAASSYFAEVVTLEIYKYFRLLVADDTHASSIEDARRGLAAALRDYRAGGRRNLSILFTAKATYVNGMPLRAPRATHEAAQELGRICGRVDATALEIASDLDSEELATLEPSLGAYLRSEGPAPETSLLAFCAVPDAVLSRGVDLPDHADTAPLRTACATAIVLLDRLLQEERSASDGPMPPVLAPALKRAAQTLADLATADAAKTLGLSRKLGPAATPAARAVAAAVLAVVMARAVECRRDVLAQVAQVSLLREIGVVRAARRPAATGPMQAPAEAAAALSASGATTLAARDRVALVYEALALETGLVLPRPPSLLAEIVYIARKYVDVREASSAVRPMPTAIVEQLRDTRIGESFLPSLRLLAATLAVELPRLDQRRKLPSLSGGGAEAHVDGGSVHEGEVARTPLPHVLVFMLDYRLSGTIVFRLPDESTRRIYFRDGAPSLASSSDDAPTPRLGEILNARGQLRAAEIEPVVEEAQEAGVRYGEYLVGEGRLSRENLELALVAQLTARVAALANLPGESRYEYVADENLLSREPGGEEPLQAHALAIIVAAVRKWEDRERIERALRRVESETLRLVHPKDAQVVRAFGFNPAELDVYERIAAGNARLVSLLRSGAPLAAVETVVSVLYMTRHLEVPGETRAPVLEPWEQEGTEGSSRRLPLDPSDEFLVERVLGSLVEQKQAERAVLEGDLEKAEIHASEAAKLNPDERENRLMMAWLAAQQDPDLLHEAAKVALELLENEPHSEFGMLYYARICRDLGRQGEARRIYGDLLRLYPENVAGKKERSEL